MQKIVSDRFPELFSTPPEMKLYTDLPLSKKQNMAVSIPGRLRGRRSVPALSAKVVLVQFYDWVDRDDKLAQEPCAWHIDGVDKWRLSD
jgi:hypothetical protein